MHLRFHLCICLLSHRMWLKFIRPFLGFSLFWLLLTTNILMHVNGHARISVAMLYNFWVRFQPCLSESKIRWKSFKSNKPKEQEKCSNRKNYSNSTASMMKTFKETLKTASTIWKELSGIAGESGKDHKLRNEPACPFLRADSPVGIIWCSAVHC